MAGFAYRFQIGVVVGSTFREWNPVMNMLDRNVHPILQTFLTPWVSSGIPLADMIPSGIVFLFAFPVALILFIIPVGDLLVFWTVAFVGQLWTAWIIAGMSRLSRHPDHSLPASHQSVLSVPHPSGLFLPADVQTAAVRNRLSPGIPSAAYPAR